MAKYTIMLKDVCAGLAGLTCPPTYDQLDDVILTAAKKIFAPGIKMKNRDIAVLEVLILNTYLFDEIGLETVAMWKHAMNTKLRTIVNYYDELYGTLNLIDDPLLGYSHTRANTVNRRGTATTSGEASSNITGSSNIESNSSNKFLDTPQGHIFSDDNPSYFTNVTYDKNKSETGTTQKNTNTSQDKSTTDGWESSSEIITGFNQSQASLLKEYRETIINLDKEFIGEFADMFMSIC